MRRLIITLTAGAVIVACNSKPPDPSIVAAKRAKKAKKLRAAERKATALRNRKIATAEINRLEGLGPRKRLSRCLANHKASVARAEKITEKAVRENTIQLLNKQSALCPDYANEKGSMPYFAEAVIDGEETAAWNKLTPAQRAAHKRKRAATARIHTRKLKAGLINKAVAFYQELRTLYRLGSGKMDRLRRNSDPLVGRRCITLLRQHRPRTLSIAADIRVIEDHNGKLFVALIGAASRMSGCVTCSRTLGPKRCKQVRSYLRKARAELRREGRRVPAVR